MQAGPPWPGADPAIRKMLGEISQERIDATMQKLGSFGTRGNFTDPNLSDRGVGAARRGSSAELPCADGAAGLPAGINSTSPPGPRAMA